MRYINHMKTIAEQVLMARRRLAWTQAELAQAAQLSRRTVSTIERGGSASSDTLDALASALGADLTHHGTPTQEGTQPGDTDRTTQAEA